MVITFCVIYKTSFATVNNGLSPGRSVFFLSVTFKKIAQKSFVFGVRLNSSVFVSLVFAIHVVFLMLLFLLTQLIQNLSFVVYHCPLASLAISLQHSLEEIKR